MKIINPVWYDDIDRILANLKDLDSFVMLMDERHKAGYDRRESLSEYCVLGRFVLDTCGNLMKFNEPFIPIEKIPDLPAVISMSKLWEYIKDYDEKMEQNALTIKEIQNNISAKIVGQTTISYSPCWLPKSKFLCPFCKSGWNIKNCHDIICKNDYEKLTPSQDFIGKPRSVFVNAAKRNSICDGIVVDGKTYSFKSFYLLADYSLQNKKYIDLKPDPAWEKDEIMRKQPSNEHGWVKCSLADPMEEGDKLLFHTSQYFHKNCYKLKNEHEILEKFNEIFHKADFIIKSVLPVKNEYCECIECSPWYKFITQFGTIKIGWRKRVVNIDWSNLKTILNPDFSKENVTQGDNYIHAWSYEKVLEYLNILREAC
jgi:hypothetical protein